MQMWVNFNMYETCLNEFQLSLSSSCYDPWIVLMPSVCSFVHQNMQSVCSFVNQVAQKLHGPHRSRKSTFSIIVKIEFIQIQYSKSFNKIGILIKIWYIYIYIYIYIHFKTCKSIWLGGALHIVSVAYLLA